MTSAPAPRLPRTAFVILFGVSIVTAFGNTGLISILPAITRQIGLPDTLAPAIFSLSALLWGITSPYWANESDKRGRKPLIALGLAGFAISMTLCGMVVFAGLHRWIAPLTVFFLFLLCRALFGLIGSASNPASQAYMAERTSREQRTQSMAGLAGAFGLGTVIGPFLAPLFVVPVLGLSGPLFGFALIAAAMVAVVVVKLEENPLEDVPGEAGRRAPAGFLASFALWKDPRLAPFLIYGFLVASAQTIQGQTLGFLIIDKLHLKPLESQGFIAVAMGAGAVSGLLAQWGLIRMFRMGPRQLLRWGVGLACLANLIVAFAPSYWAVVAGYALASLGYGFARPGFTAGASLSVDGSEQARAAGAIASINGSSVVVAPVLGVYLYERLHAAPFLLNVALLAGLVAYAVLQPTLRTVGDGSAESAGEMSELERSEEAGGGL